MNEIDAQAFQHAIAGDFSSPYSKAGEALWERSSDNTPNPTPNRLISSTHIPKPHIPTRRIDSVTSGFNRIVSLDWTAHSYRPDIAQQLERLSYGGRTVELEVISQLKSYADRLRSHVQEIGDLDVGQQGPSADYKRKVMQNFMDWAATLDSTVESIDRRTVCDESNALAVDMQQGSYFVDS